MGGIKVGIEAKKLPASNKPAGVIPTNQLKTLELRSMLSNRQVALRSQYQLKRVFSMSRYAYEVLVVLLLFAWIIGWLVWPVGGILIHFLLILALAVVAFRLLGVRRTVP